MTHPSVSSTRPDDAPFGETVTREPRLSDKVSEMMRQTILSRRLLPGTPLPSERDLGMQFGVSRTVVREAVRDLAAKGIVEVRSGSGLRVAAVDEATVADSLAWFIRGGGLEYPKVHEVRSMVEVEMAGLAATRRTDSQLDSLRKAHQRMVDDIRDTEAAARADLAFHALIARATQNDLFAVILASVGTALIEIRRANLATGTGSQTLSEHQTILKHIEAQDPAAARAAMTAHLESVKRIWEAQQARAGAARDAVPPPGRGAPR